MNDFVKRLKTMPDFFQLKGVTDDEIKKAEENLKLEFSNEYKEYLRVCGCASSGSYEFTGICKSPRLDVVVVTESNRTRFPDADKRWYVVEETGNDGIIIWQCKDGTVYATAPGKRSTEICKSLGEYLDLQ